jgi:hypothetical protein
MLILRAERRWFYPVFFEVEKMNGSALDVFLRQLSWRAAIGAILCWCDEIRDKKVKPAQDPLLHSSYTMLSPKQWSPKRCGRGLVQNRFRLLIPTSQVAEHVPQLSHELQPPCTVML